MSDMSYGYIPEGGYADWARAIDKAEKARRNARNAAKKVNVFASRCGHGGVIGVSAALDCKECK